VLAVMSRRRERLPAASGCAHSKAANDCVQ
jgi:hypothetical protein